MPHVILFVDDEPDVLALLRRTFPARDGYEALTARGGEEALLILAGRPVDLLVTDQRMPGMTGVELIAEARRRVPDLCAILLTAYADPRDIVDAINKGEVYRYLVKPWESHDLRQTVVRALEQVQLKRDKASLCAELECRLAALQAASEIARDVGAADGRDTLVERVLERLPSIVPCDVAAALLAPSGGAPVLIVRPTTPLPESALAAVEEIALAALAEHAGAAPDAAALEVRVTGAWAGAGPTAFASSLILPVQLSGATAGVVVLGSAREAAFGEGDARVLHVLVNELAESLRAFAAKLVGERRRLERMVESLADGLLFAAHDAGEVIANPAARRMLGAPAGALPAAWLEETLGFSPFSLVRAHPAGERSFAAEELRRGERTLASIVSPVPDATGHLAGVAVVLRDVTEQKRLEASKEEFVQVVSHELRTPLTSITGALDLLLNGIAGVLEGKQERYVRMARESAEKLNGLVDDILDVARLARGKLRMELDATSLGELVRAAVERYQPAAAERGLELHLELPEAPLRLIADAARLGQVLSNLLTNAVKFAPSNGVIRVRVFRSDALPGLVGLSVWNSGEGIPEDDLERIFEKFERSERTRRVRGTGLGLAICRGIVEAHGGRIWAESAPGEGARLVAVVPEETPRRSAEAAEPGAPVPARAAAEPPVAVIVDAPDEAALARAVLTRAGFRCHAAGTAEDALALIRRHRPRLVLLDPRLPALASLPFTEILKHDADARAAALLAFSAPSAREATSRAGAVFVAKPAAPGTLAAAAAGLLERARPAGARVLVVDDDPSIRAICADVLASEGYEVLEAKTCAAARVLVRERRPQALLVDVELPDGDALLRPGG